MMFKSSDSEIDLKIITNNFPVNGLRVHFLRQLDASLHGFPGLSMSVDPGLVISDIVLASFDADLQYSIVAHINTDCKGKTNLNYFNY